MNVRILLSGRHYHLADGIPRELTLDDGSSVDDALQALHRMMPDGNRLPASCLVAVGSAHLGTLADHQPRRLKDGDELVLVAPVAGG